MVHTGHTPCVHISTVPQQQLCHLRVSVAAREMQRCRTIVVFCNVSGCMHNANGTYSVRSHPPGTRPAASQPPCVRSGMRDAAVSVRGTLFRCEWLHARRKRDVPFTFTSAWFLTSSFATSVSLFSHARCSGVRPIESFTV
jgi:hypothetical protein